MKSKLLTLLFGISIFLGTKAYSSDYYWVGGSGDWTNINHWVTTSGGTINHIQTPTASDNVIFDMNSMSSAATINLNIAIIFCKNFDVQQINSTLTFSGICSTWRIYGSFKLNNQINLPAANLYFEALSGTHEIKTANKNISTKIYFKGLATWNLMDSLTCGNIYFESGTFNTNSNYIFGQAFTSNSNINRQINLGNSEISFSDWKVVGTGYSVNAGNSKIAIRTTYFQHSGIGNLNYNDLIFENQSLGNLSNPSQLLTFRKVIFNGDGGIVGNNIFDSLIFTKGKSYEILTSTTQTIQYALVAIGDCKKKISISSPGSFASFLKSSGSISCAYLILEHIHASGGANFQASGSEDLGDNLGWNLSPAATRNLYWVGGSGNWSDTLHWSASSGGLGGECIPTIVDNVIVDINSYILPLQITINNSAICHDFTWQSAAIGNMAINSLISISGSLYFGSQLSLAINGNIYFISNDQGETVHTSNINLNQQHIRFFGDGSWTLTDNIYNSGGDVYLIRGHLLTSSNYIKTRFFGATSKEPKILSLSNSTIDVESVCRFQQDSLSINPGNSHIRMIGDKPLFESVGPDPDTLYNLSFMPDTSLAHFNSTATTFNKIHFLRDVFLEGISTSDTLQFEKGNSFVFSVRTDTIKKALIANGTCNQTITLREPTGLSHFQFFMPPTSTVSCSHVNIRGSKAIGGANFTATNSSDLSSNLGWTFSNTASNHYWVNNQGNWDDPSHWSYTSGGSGGACIPKIFDNVYFDANSFSSSNDSVLIDSNDIFCQNMDWTGATGNPIFSFQSNIYTHYISGSMKLIRPMTFIMENETFFVWTQLNKTIDMAGNFYNGNIIFCDSGQWTLLDTLFVKSTLYHHFGGLIANQKPIYTESYWGTYDKTKTLNIQNTTVNIIKGGPMRIFSWVKSSQTHFLSSNSEINFVNGGILQTRGTGLIQFHNVNFHDTLAFGEVQHPFQVSNKFSKLLFDGSGKIHGDNYMDTLIFTKDGTYELEGGANQYITNDWQANADCYGPIIVKGSVYSTLSPSNIANVHKTNGNISLAGVKLQNITGIGSGSFSVSNGTDLGGNSSNWLINSSPSRILYWVNNTGDWYDTAHWSLSNGGISGECIPTYIDDVHFTQLSFVANSDTAFSSYGIDCHSMYWNFTPSEPLMDISTLNIYGSLWLGDTMTINPTSEFYFKAEDTGNIIRSADKSLYLVNFLTQGEWSLFDDLKSTSIDHQKGNFIMAGNSINTIFYKSLTTHPRTFNIANSNLNVSYKMEIKTDTFNLMASNSRIKFDSPLANPILTLKLEGNQPLQFNEVSFEPVMAGISRIENTSSSHHNFSKVTINNSADIYGEHFFDSLIFTAGNTYQLEKSKTQDIGNYWFIRGNNCFAITLQSTTKDQTAFVNKNTGIVTGDFINMRDIHAIGGANYFAGDFSTDIANNTGWVFSNGSQYVYGLGPDTSLMLGGTITLSTANFNGGPNTTYLWSTGSTSPNIQISQTGWYFITVTYAGNCIVYDSIWVSCNLDMNYNTYNNPCFGDSLGSIQALVPDTSYSYQYLWSTNAVTDSISGLLAGNYSVIIYADSGTCTLYDTIAIGEPPPVISPQGDTAFCLGDSVMLDLGPFVSFDWNDGYTNQYRWISQEDSFLIRVLDMNNCWSMPDTVHVRQDLPPNISIGIDTTICIGDQVVLEVDAGYDAYLWSNNSAMNSITISNTGIYWVIVSKKTCKIIDSIEVFNCPPIFNVPNVFTPNGDGSNDYFDIEYQNIYEFEIKIYNRWGRIVYKGNSLENPWDGKIKGQDAIEGVYFWEIQYQEYSGLGNGTGEKSVKGTVSLYR